MVPPYCGLPKLDHQFAAVVVVLVLAGGIVVLCVLEVTAVEDVVDGVDVAVQAIQRDNTTRMIIARLSNFLFTKPSLTVNFSIADFTGLFCNLFELVFQEEFSP